MLFIFDLRFDATWVSGKPLEPDVSCRMPESVNDGSVSVTVSTVLNPLPAFDIFFAHPGSSGGTDGQSNGDCIRSRYDIDVSVRVAGNAQTPALSLANRRSRHRPCECFLDGRRRRG